MRRNVEIKARLRDPGAVETRAAALADEGPIVIEQEDTFFHCRDGRLKLRELSPSQGELIHYQRHDSTEPRPSDYAIARTPDPAALREVLSGALGTKGIVRKRRRLYLIGDTRIHIDAVERLGDFAEIEVVLGPEQSIDSGVAAAEELMENLGIGRNDLVAYAYIDLLAGTDGQQQ